MGRGPQVVAVLLAGALAACAGVGDEPVASSTSALAVEDYVDSSCATSVVLGLSTQIAQEVNCMAPGTLVPFEEGGGIVFTGSAVLPYIAPEAKQDLLGAVAAAGGTLQVNSAYRTVVQQYLLYRWFQQGRCGITAAATPGNSNHETGRALDVNNYSQWIGALENAGWSHSVPGDPVHFDHLGSPDLRGMDVIAFQRLWNRNHPEDLIDEDGAYGPQTAARIAASPADGFPIGGGCMEPPPPGEDWNAARASEPGVIEVESGERIEVFVELVNSGNTTWKPGETFLGTTAPRDRESALYDAADWVSPGRPTTVDAETPPGATGRFSFVVLAPDVDAETTFAESFGLVREGVTWFGPEDLTVELVVRPAGSAGGDGPPDDAYDGLSGGCAATGARGGGGGGAWLLALAALLYVGGRRRGRIIFTSSSRS